MKLIDLLCRWRSGVLLVIGLSIVCWPISGVSVAQPAGQYKSDATPAAQEKEKTGRAPKPQVRQEVESIPLKYAKARDVWGTIQQMFGRGSRDFRYSIDERNNSVLVVGEPEDIALLKSLLSKLDVLKASGPLTKVITQVYHLQYTPADSNLTNSLRLVLGDEGNFGVDPTRNVVILTGNQNMQAAAELLLQRLDRPPENKPKIAGEMQVRVVWLSSGLPGIGAEKVPEDLKDVVGELAKMGVNDPRLVTQTLVTALPDRKFELGGLAGPESQYRLSISGTLLAQAGEAGRLRILIDAKQSTTNVTVGRVDSEITAPLGHSVVLGMTPTARTTSVFVVQILPRK